ncbi:hypothetical protein JZX86_24485, partial [Agrobacterium rosae]|nr:hypothetical protein [Agrobacterium rosae]
PCVHAWKQRHSIPSSVNRRAPKTALTVIPGAKSAEQANANALGSSIAELSPSTMETIKTIYENRIAPHVHQLW